MAENYLGNPLLKRSNVKIEFSRDEIQEYIKCSRDPIHFIETYLKIVNIDKGLVNFDLYEYQKEIVETTSNNRFTICKLPRQAGKTTTIVGVILWHVIFNESYNVAILANKLQQAREILSRIQLAYENLPKWLQQGVLEWNKGNIELENGSKILASATSSSAIRGGSFNMVYLDEFAFVENNMQEEFFASVYPTITSGTSSKVIITSTPNGLNMFYKIWADSEEGKNDYKRIDVHWSDVPGRDEAWKLQTIKNTSAEQFRVEFECEFIGSSSTLIAGSKLRQLAARSPIKINDNLKVYSDPLAERLYTVVVDTSRGTENDYSAFVVFDITEAPYRHVAVFRDNKIKPIIYPTVIRSIASAYNNANVLVEINDIGQQVAEILYHDMEYENVFFTSSVQKAGTRITAGFGHNSYLGVRTTKAVKKIGCSNLKTLVESDKLIIEDADIIYELMRFSSKGDSYEAEDGNDDLAMCCVLFSWMIDQQFIKELNNIDMRKKLNEENVEMIETQLLPFGFVQDGRDDNLENVITLETDSFDDWLMDRPAN